MYYQPTNLLYNNKFKIDDILLLKLDRHYYNNLNLDVWPNDDRTLIGIVTEISKPYSIEYLRLKIISSNWNLKVGEPILATDDNTSSNAYVPFKDITLLN